MYSTIIFKDLLLNSLANQSQTSRGASLGKGMKVYINGPGHMTKMVSMAMNRKKKLKNLLLQNQKPYDLDTWPEASGRGALKN